MASTFTANLKLELIGNGDQSGAWGTTTNNNWGNQSTTQGVEQAIVGLATLTSSDFTSNVATFTPSNSASAQNFRALCLTISASSLSAAGTINVPAIQKPYIIINNDSYAVTVKVSGLTGVSVPAGKRTVVYNNGTDVGNQIDYLAGLTLGSALPIASGGTGTSSTTFVNLATNVTGTLPVANGGSGAATLTGVLKGNGTSAFTAATAGTDYVAPGAATTFTALQTFNNGITVSSSLLYQGPTKQKITSVTASTSTTTIDLSTADTFIVTVSANTSLVFSNAPTDGTMKSFNMIIQNTSTGGYAVSFPVSVGWAGGSTPPRTTTANAKDLWSFFTVDGSVYAGSLSIKNY